MPGFQGKKEPPSGGNDVTFGLARLDTTLNQRAKRRAGGVEYRRLFRVEQPDKEGEFLAN